MKTTTNHTNMTTNTRFQQYFTAKLENKFCEIARHFIDKGFTVSEAKTLAKVIMNEAADIALKS